MDIHYSHTYSDLEELNWSHSFIRFFPPFGHITHKSSIRPEIHAENMLISLLLLYLSADLRICIYHRYVQISCSKYTDTYNNNRICRKMKITGESGIRACQQRIVSIFLFFRAEMKYKTGKPESWKPLSMFLFCSVNFPLPT